MKVTKKSGNKIQKRAKKQTKKKDPLTLKNADLRTILTLKSKADAYVTKRHRVKKRVKWDQREEGLKFQVRSIHCFWGGGKFFVGEEFLCQSLYRCENELCRKWYFK